MTAYTAQTAIQAAIHGVLANDATLSGMAEGPYDHVPSGAGYPRIVHGEPTETPWNTHSEFGRNSTYLLHVWTKDTTGSFGYPPGAAIVRRIVELLDHQTLDMSAHGVRNVSVTLIQSEAFREGNDLRHHVVRFRLLTEEA